MPEAREGELLVYGDFLQLSKLKVYTTLEKAPELLIEVEELEKVLLTGFVSFILARAGFFSKFIFDEREDLGDLGEKGPTKYTTNFEDDDWVESMLSGGSLRALTAMNELLSELPAEPLFKEDKYKFYSIISHLWSHPYQNRLTDKMLRVIFVGKSSGSRVIERDSQGRLLVTYYFVPTTRTYLVIHPATVKHVGDEFWKELAEVRSSFAEENVSLVSTDEFVHHFIPDDQESRLVLENWISIRDKVLSKLLEDWPALILASKGELLASIAELFRRAYAEYLEKRFDQAIMDFGKACEALLQIIYYMHTGKEPDSQKTFNDLLSSVAEFVEEKFGSITVNDLVFIREWRNSVAHPTPNKRPTEEATLQVMKRSELFYELFKRFLEPFILE